MKNNRGGTIVLHLDFLSLCNAFGDSLRVKAAAQHSSSEPGSAFALALHLPKIICAPTRGIFLAHERGKKNG